MSGSPASELSILQICVSEISDEKTYDTRYFNIIFQINTAR